MTRTAAEVKELFARNLYPVYQMPGEEQEYIPYDIIAPHERQAAINHGQSLQRLAERGGLDWGELLAVLTGQAWGRYGTADRDRLRAAVQKYIAEKGSQERTERM